MSRRPYTKPPEACTQSAIMDFLAAKHVLAFRMNTGALKMENRVIRFGVPGMGDILAFPRSKTLWIEVKSPKGKQTPEQKSFEAQVLEAGHSYVVARSIEDVEAYL